MKQPILLWQVSQEAGAGLALSRKTFRANESQAREVARAWTAQTLIAAGPWGPSRVDVRQARIPLTKQALAAWLSELLTPETEEEEEEEEES